MGKRRWKQALLERSIALGLVPLGAAKFLCDFAVFFIY